MHAHKQVLGSAGFNLFSGDRPKDHETLTSEKESAKFGVGGDLQEARGRGMSIHDLMSDSFNEKKRRSSKRRSAAREDMPFEAVGSNSTDEQDVSDTRVHDATAFSMNLTKQSYKDRKPARIDPNAKPSPSDDALTPSASIEISSSQIRE